MPRTIGLLRLLLFLAAVVAGGAGAVWFLAAFQSRVAPREPYAFLLFVPMAVAVGLGYALVDEAIRSLARKEDES